ncbi:hypothetical protein Tco_0662972 [Tanacetum coccineum]
MTDSVKDMMTKFEKLDKFKGSDFRRWQKKMNFLLTTLKVVNVLTAPMPEYVEEETLEETRKRCKSLTRIILGKFRLEDLKMKNKDDEDKDKIKGLIWVYNHISNKKGKGGQM